MASRPGGEGPAPSTQASAIACAVPHALPTSGPVPLKSHSTIVWVCERCGDSVTQEVEVFPYSDPVQIPPEGWDYAKDEETWCCASCLDHEGRNNPC
jgi:hypothetical protein